ncbi:1-deoxy-D-xylulose-5-phosphate reductoisomerase [Desulfobulbus alkaliphilus]|uniref:1-deoxy-D-xylulose-5-phosphate reductoisomerase n=1 Tax=Desulfobulbus alkaliphilus TaxID=869814 RepID=UPI0019643EAC|nr:1-deoxy-D-xylulose-5-phosphate reductoisomerase [Desulfobulbus alkaliphilus]MBM9535873.1 1-deoxy-D-xylulose-5-phosphate reductoisomerase [Desulfobulbus alkaliphilus]
MKTLALLGSTGSIGRNVLAVVRQFPDRFRLIGLAAGRQINLLAQQVLEFEPEFVSVADASLVPSLAEKLPVHYRTRILHGMEGNCTIATLPSADMLVSAVVGAVGLLPALAAIKAGKDIGLANKETLVMAGRLIMSTARQRKVRLLPIDSEHSAIFQALEAGRRQDVARIILTASGGPFRTWSRETMETATPDQALAHPNWDMGRKISIDSATLMNKGLEVIEARWLFDMDPERIEVVVHPQSIVHSLVEFRDGAVVAQLGVPDMRIPIAYALTYPERLDLGLVPLSLSQCGHLAFEQPASDRFPALALAYRALAMGGVKPAVLNAANEVAVEAFLAGRIAFPRIAEIVGTTLEKTAQGDELDLEAILAADGEARIIAGQEIPAT